VNPSTIESIPLFASVPKRRRWQVARLADEVAVPAGRELTRQGGYAQEFFVVVSGTADVFRDDEHVGTLERLRTLMAPERWHHGTAGPEPVAFEAQSVAELSRADGQPDPEPWASAAERFVALRMPFEVSYARWRQAEALIGGGDRSGAAQALREAAEIAASLPAPLLAAEVVGLARRARVPLASAPQAAPESPELDRLGLTAREHTVLALVAEGHTNREIGATLFISEKTATVHVSRILAKLGVRSRVEAATAAHRLGLTAASAPGDGGRG
jgi:DNA-binding CsgD family transcriptional regulator